MLLYEAEIQKKVKKLPENLKKEVLDYAEYLSKKYPKRKEKIKKGENSFKELSGFISIGSLSSSDIDREVYNL